MPAKKKTTKKVETADSLEEIETPVDKSLNVTSSQDVVEKVEDVEIFGNPETWALLSKASSKSQGWMKSTKAMQLPMGVLIQVSTQQCNNVAEALQYIPDVKIANIEGVTTITKRF